MILQDSYILKSIEMCFIKSNERDDNFPLALQSILLSLKLPLSFGFVACSCYYLQHESI